MTNTIELPSGKIIDLNRFVALIPDEKKTDNTYFLILEGCEKAIILDAIEATSVKKHIRLESNKNHNGVWDREEQLRKNQPAIELLKKRIERIKNEPPSPEKEAAFEEFKKIIDAERSTGRKLYEK
ncbi:MAG: hypothetical protein KME09_26495 [Pleurocapsa minor HA4230-MV1]|jgi:hypothetical protein|nr:hypothetical protein [Pleurocapsa minor HA4230-MV1]